MGEVLSIEKTIFSIATLVIILLLILGGCVRSIPAPVEYRKASSEQIRAPLPKVRPSVEVGNLHHEMMPKPSNKPSVDDNDDERLTHVDEDTVGATPNAKTSHQLDQIQAVNQTIVVRRGDTLYAVARRGKTSMLALIAVNRLKAPYKLIIGQKLVLPPPQNYIVLEGDTIYAISRRFGVDMLTLVRANRIPSPFVIKVGQSLHVPSIELVNPSFNGDTNNLKSRSSAVGKGSFVWPVKGQLLSDFGPKGGGLHNDGINIGAEHGTIVRAAENGVVAYAGNELRGFGKLLLIRHADSWVTAYAHNSELLVARGDTVKRGQAISRVGTSGSVQRPQLHFEVRMGTRAIDPMLYLSRESTSTRGSITRVESLNHQQDPV